MSDESILRHLPPTPPPQRSPTLAPVHTVAPTPVPEVVDAGRRSDGPAPDEGPGAKSRKLDDAELTQAVKRLNDLSLSIRRELQFSIDEGSGRTVIKVLDSESKEIIRQIPPEEVLSVIERLEAATGGLVQEIA